MEKQLLILSIMSLTACALPRAPSPIQIVLLNDPELSCPEIQFEYRANTQAATAKILKNILSDQMESEQGCLVWPKLPDYKNADGLEGNALLHRNIRLRKLAETQDCNVSSYPEQPPHYE